MVKLRYLLLFISTLLLSSAQAQLSNKQVDTVVKEVINTLDNEFIIPELKPKLVEGIRQHLKNKAYYGLESENHLAKKITLDMQALTGDKHLYLMAANDKKNVNPQPQRRMVRMGMGDVKFEDVISYEVLAGNIAYVNVQLFPSVEANKDAFLTLLKNTTQADALIVDVRECRGGVGNAVAYLLGGYIAETTLLTTYYSKEGAGELWTPKTEFGVGNANKDLFVLTSKKTGSAGEAMAFYPQQLGRVTVVGQRSAGAGRSNQIFDLSEGFKLSVSVRTSITPNGKQFQGVGVQPDILTAASHAKTQAHLTALANLKKRNPDQANYEGIIQSISEEAEKQQVGAISEKDKAGIEQAVLGYIENFFENNTEEMMNYLHPDLAKGGVSKKRGEEVYFYENMSVEKLKGMLNSKPFVAKSEQKNEVQILDVFRNTASVKLNTGYSERMKWIEYILLTKIEDGWKVNHVMWDYYPMQRRMKRQKSN